MRTLENSGVRGFRCCAPACRELPPPRMTGSRKAHRIPREMADSRNIETLFVSLLYRAQISARGLNDALAKTCLAFAAEDKAGQRWAKAHGYKGYTSYASLDDLPYRASVFDELV